MPINFSVSEWLKEDEFNYANAVRRARFARDIKADITMENSGVWTELPDGRKVWRVAIEAKNAKALLLRYNEFYLPEGSKLFLYSLDKTNVLKVFDSKSNRTGGKYSTPLVAGDVTVLEYVAPLQETGDVARIKVEGVGYGYNFIKIEKKSDNSTQAAGDSYSCEVNVICSPEGDNWQEQSKSVCAIYAYVLGGLYEMCSGTLINNTRNDGTPYIISAAHCYEPASLGVTVTPEEFLQWQFRFFFESKTCELPNTGYDDDDEIMVGCYLRAASSISGGSDGVLFELKDPIPSEWIDGARIRFAGWDRRHEPSVMAQSGVGISHPALDVKKISTISEQASIIGNINFGIGTTAPDAHWDIWYVETPNGWGESEGGSSGSGLFNQDGRLIGTLSGGPNVTDCSGGNSKRAYFGSLWYHWDKFGTDPSKQMKPWLDPDDTGAEYIDYYPNTINANFTGDPTSIYVLESVNFKAITYKIDSVDWVFEGGTPATSNDPNPVVAYNTAGVFDVTLNAYGKSDVTGNDTVITVTKEDYITATIKGGTPVVPVADFGVIEYPTAFSDNATTPPTTVARVGTTGAATATYLKEAHSWFYDSETDAQLWIRTNTYYNASGPASNGASGPGDYYYCFYYPTSGTYWARMYNRVPIDLSTYATATLNFKYATQTWAGDVDGLRVYYRTSSSGSWTMISGVGFDLDTENTGKTWKSTSVTLPAGALSANLQISFEATTGWGYGVGIDDIKILGDPYIADHVIIWEGDAVNYGDFSTGPAVLYKYEFEGGEPAESTVNTSPITVQYNVGNTTNYTGSNPNDYSASQWVKNTEGEDTKVRDAYVTVIGRKLEADADTILGECGAEINETITLTTNRNWTLTAPSWLTVTPTSGTVATAGVEETFTITLTAPLHISYQANAGTVKFVSDDGKVTYSIFVGQATQSPHDITVTRYDSVNAEIRWYRVPGMPDPPEPPVPPSACDISIAGGGDFEDNFSNASALYSQILVKSGIGGARWFNGASYANSPTHFLAFESYTLDGGANVDADTWFVTPKLKVSVDHHTLSLWARQFDANWKDYWEIKLYQGSTPPTSPSDFNVSLKPLARDGSTSYTEYSFDLTSYVGQEVYVAIHHADYGQWALLIDDISGLELAECTGGDPIQENAGQTMLSLDVPFTLLASNSKLRSTDDEDLEKLQAKLESHSNYVKNLLARNPAGNSNDNKVESQSNAVVQAINIADLDPLKWCTGYDQGWALGLGNKGAFKVAAKWTPAELTSMGVVGKGLLAVEIATEDASAQIELFVMEGNTVIYTQPAGTLNINAPTLIEFTNPVAITGNADLYIGYSIAAGYAGYPAGQDVGPAVPGKGDLADLGAGWENVSDYGFTNFYIIGYAGSIGKYQLYRQRSVNGVPVEEPVIVSVLSSSDTVYNDVNIKPGGEYCYWVTYAEKDVESCPSDTGCVFILYQQTLEPIDNIEMTYGDPQFFKIDKAGTDGYVLKTDVDDIDYFAGRTVPVRLEILSGNSVLLTGVESDYTLELERAGVTLLRATQEGIIPVVVDTLLPAEPIEFTVTVKKGDLLVIAGNNYVREEGQVNDPVIYTLDYQSFFYDDNVDTLDVKPTATCVADPLSPVGDYAIVVNVGLDQRYNVIPVNGLLKVKESTVKVNAFTPDGDGLNDAFMPRHKMKIFNRYGVLIYETRNKAEQDRGWNGRFQDNEKLVNPGVYYYILYDDNGKAVRKGSVNVVKK
jgi:gliding motility-associated-like protein